MTDGGCPDRQRGEQNLRSSRAEGRAVRLPSGQLGLSLLVGDDTAHLHGLPRRREEGGRVEECLEVVAIDVEEAPNLLGRLGEWSVRRLRSAGPDDATGRARVELRPADGLRFVEVLDGARGELRTFTVDRPSGALVVLRVDPATGTRGILGRWTPSVGEAPYVSDPVRQGDRATIRVDDQILVLPLAGDGVISGVR